MAAKLPNAGLKHKSASFVTSIGDLKAATYEPNSAKLVGRKVSGNDDALLPVTRKSEGYKAEELKENDSMLSNKKRGK